MSGNVEWKGAAFFAEVAETLKVPTEIIFGVSPTKAGGWLVLYTPGWPDDETMWAAKLERDKDGILQHAAPARELRGFSERLDQVYEEAARLLEEDDE